MEGSVLTFSAVFKVINFFLGGSVAEVGPPL